MSNFTKIILRQGVENDRSNVVYSVGEPIYTTDYKRLFIGDGVTSGGILAGNKFLGFTSFDLSTNTTGLTSAHEGDIVFDFTTNNLYALTGSNPNLLASYSKITRNFTADNVTTVLTETSAISVKMGSLNANYLSFDICGRGLEKNNTKIQMSDPSFNGGLDYDFDGRLKIANNSITNAMLKNVQGNTVKGNIGSFGEVEDIPLATLASFIAPFLVGIDNSVFSVPIGTIIDFGGTNIPSDYLLCDGSPVSKSDYPELYDAIGYNWGGSGDIFHLPDLRRKTTVGSGGTGTLSLNSTIGSVGGSENISLELGNIPKHFHSYKAVSQTVFSGDSLNSGSGSLMFDESLLTGDGSDQGLSDSIVGKPFSNFQPSAVVTKCIRAF